MPDLRILEGLGDSKNERRTLRKVGIAAALVVIGFMLAGWVYARTEPIVERVTALETHRERDKEWRERIEDKVDFLIERLIR